MSTRTAGSRRSRLVSDILINGVLAFIVILWCIPTIGLLVSSFRDQFSIQTTGWWTVFPHQAWVQTETKELPPGLDANGIMTIEGVQGTFEEFRAGVASGEKQITWVGNKRRGRLEIQEQQWTNNANFTLDNYAGVLTGKQYEVKQPDGSVEIRQGDDMSAAFINSLAVSIPSTLIPIAIAAFAAYGFAWMNFAGRKWFFMMVIALLVVPLQIALVPVLRDYVALDLNGTFLGVWLAHTGFGLSLAVYLLYNYISLLPRDIFESAFLDGATHFIIFTRLVIPLSIPALASFAIFQFLWVWNDYLVALIFIGAAPDVQVLTMRLAEIAGSRGNDWQLLTAGAFVSMILPVTVFLLLQRYFVRGLLAGSVKG